jgi:hypothetical protein
MAPPNKNFAGSLRTQRHGGGREQPPPTVQQLRRGGPTMTVPGEGKVAGPPGRQDEGRQSRSAAEHAKPMARFGGGSNE